MVLGDLKRPLKLRLRGARRVYAIDVLWRTYRRFVANQGTVYAAAVSYYALFSLFPLLIFLVTVFGFVIRDPADQQRVTNLITAQIPAEVNLRRQVQQMVASIATTNSGLLGVVALIGAAWTASGMFGAMRRALNRTFGVPAARSYIHGRLLDLASVVAVTALILLSTALTAGLGIIRAIAANRFNSVLLNLAWGVVYFCLPFATSFSVFLLMYRMVPNLRLKIRDLWVSALAAAVGFEAAKGGISLYVARFGQFNRIYGTLGGIVAFMLFVFLVVNIIIFSAGIASELAKDRESASEST